MKPAIRVLLGYLLFALSACTDGRRFIYPPGTEPAGPSADQAFRSYEFEELTRYGGTLARLSPADRAAECRKVLELQRLKPDLGVSFHLFLAQLSSDDCGDLAESIKRLDDKTIAGLQDRRLRGYLEYQKLLAERRLNAQAAESRLQKQLKQARGREQKALRQAKTREKDAKDLREKLDTVSSQLDALKNIEKGKSESLREKLDAIKTIEQDLTGSERHNTGE